jgi:hypothetical protein
MFMLWMYYWAVVNNSVWEYTGMYVVVCKVYIERGL